MRLKPSAFLQKKLEKLGLIAKIDEKLHGDLICYVVSFKAECRWVSDDYEHEKRIVTISRGSAERCPYRIDYPAYRGGIHRDMFSLSHFDNPWDKLCQKLWELDFGKIQFMHDKIEDANHTVSMGSNVQVTTIDHDGVRLIKLDSRDTLK